MYSVAYKKIKKTTFRYSLVTVLIVWSLEHCQGTEDDSEIQAVQANWCDTLMLVPSTRMNLNRKKNLIKTGKLLKKKNHILFYYFFQ